MLGLALVVTAELATAAKWDISESYSANVVASDNRGQRVNGGATLFTELRPSVHLVGEGRRIKTSADYALGLSQYVVGASEAAATHHLNSALQSELYRDIFFFDVNATAGLASQRSTYTAVDSLSSANDSQQVFTLSVAPRFRHHLGSYVDIHSDNTFNWVATESAASDSSWAESANIGVASGRQWARLPWQINLTRATTHYSTRDDVTTGLEAATQYGVDRFWRVRGNLGYEKNDIATTRASVDGMTWDSGVNWAPNPRTNIDLSFGKRYFGNHWSMRLNHQTRRSSMSVAFSRDLSSLRAEALALLTQPRLNADGTPQVDPISGDPVYEYMFALLPVEENFVHQVLNASYVLNGKRSSLSVSGYVSERSYELTRRQETATHLDIALSRRFSPVLNGSLGLGMGQVESNFGTPTKTYDVNASLTHPLGRKTRLSLQLLHRASDGGPADTFSENRITLGVNGSFN